MQMISSVQSDSLFRKCIAEHAFLRRCNRDIIEIRLSEEVLITLEV